MALIQNTDIPSTYYICDNCGEVIEGDFYRIEDKHYCYNCVYVDNVEDALTKIYF